LFLFLTKLFLEHGQLSSFKLEAEIRQLLFVGFRGFPKLDHDFVCQQGSFLLLQPSIDRVVVFLHQRFHA